MCSGDAGPVLASRFDTQMVRLVKVAVVHGERFMTRFLWVGLLLVLVNTLSSVDGGVSVAATVSASPPVSR